MLSSDWFVFRTFTGCMRFITLLLVPTSLLVGITLAFVGDLAAFWWLLLAVALLVVYYYGFRRLSEVERGVDALYLRRMNAEKHKREVGARLSDDAPGKMTAARDEAAGNTSRSHTATTE